MILYLFIAKEGTSRKMPSTQRMSNKISRSHVNNVFLTNIVGIIVSNVSHQYSVYKSEN